MHPVRRQKFFDPSFVVTKSKIESEQEVSGDTYIVKNSFVDFKLLETVKNNIISRGYLRPTPIQDQAIPLILEGKDVVGIANTGTGKTAAFLIPLINKVYQDRSNRVLIMAPTRELAIQISEEFLKFTAGLNLNFVLCIGGTSLFPQILRLKRGPQFVIGTPGRLVDLAQHRAIFFEDYNNIVLDEVDRMLDIGFAVQIKAIISALPESRQSLFFSATFPKEAVAVMNSLLKNPTTVSVKTTDNLKSVNQGIIKTNGKPKTELLCELLRKEEFKKVLVFGRTKHGVGKLAIDLERRGFRVAVIHGNKSQNQRQRAIADFKNNYVRFLLATDVASRGLDIKDITHVINFDLPESYEDYIHRIGRTGRADKSGTALTLI